MLPKTSKILVADDAETVMTLVKGFLKERGYVNVDTAFDGDIALEMMVESVKEGTPFDLVIADIHMPQMDGLKLLETSKRIPALQNIPFLIMTGETKKEVVLSAVVKGALSYLVKPFDGNSLIQKANEAYDRNQAKHKAF